MSDERALRGVPTDRREIVRWAGRCLAALRMFNASRRRREALQVEVERKLREIEELGRLTDEWGEIVQRCARRYAQAKDEREREIARSGEW